MLLIASGQFVESELYAEFGAIPPCFLPLGNERLYMHQVRALAGQFPDIVLTLPDVFEIDLHDASALAALGVRVISTPVEAELRTAVRTVLQQLEAEGRVDILFGDTLVDEGELGGESDWIGVGNSSDYYHWHYDDPSSESSGLAWAGMFSFSDARTLVHCLSQASSFTDAVTRYGRGPLALQRRPLRRWLDFGHVHTYFRSRLAVTTERHFNSLAVANGVLQKSSTDHRKMDAEAAWFERAPTSIRPFLPNYIGRNGHSAANGYALEYLHLTALNELYVFGRLPDLVWRRIFAACEAFLAQAASVPVHEPSQPDFARRWYGDKTEERLAAFASQSGVGLDSGWTFNGQAVPSLRAMALGAAAAVCANPVVDSFVHGDFCFSNILFDFRAGRIRVIDPRGLDVDGRITPLGDLRYDVAKLAHSVLGLYDVIVAGFFRLEIDGQNVQFELPVRSSRSLRRIFRETRFAGRTPAEWDCDPLMVLLFLSMLPLHVDKPERQRAFMANAMRMYVEWKKP